MKRRLGIALIALAVAFPLAAGDDAPRAAADEGSVVQVANLIYAGTKSSQCFSDHFLSLADRTTTITTNRRFHAVKLASEDLFSFPLVIMTGEGDFELLDEERTNLKRYLEKGGFMLASAGCSSQTWDVAFRREIRKLFPERAFDTLPMTHAVFHTVKDIRALRVRHGTPQPFRGLQIAGRLALVYSVDGLNDTPNATGCCCCGGNEIVNSEEVNLNILAYALAY